MNGMLMSCWKGLRPSSFSTGLVWLFAGLKTGPAVQEWHGPDDAAAHAVAQEVGEVLSQVPERSVEIRSSG